MCSAPFHLAVDRQNRVTQLVYAAWHPQMRNTALESLGARGRDSKKLHRSTTTLIRAPIANSHPSDSETSSAPGIVAPRLRPRDNRPERSWASTPKENRHAARQTKHSGQLPKANRRTSSHR